MLYDINLRAGKKVWHTFCVPIYLYHLLGFWAVWTNSETEALESIGFLNLFRISWNNQIIVAFNQIIVAFTFIISIIFNHFFFQIQSEYNYNWKYIHFMSDVNRIHLELLYSEYCTPIFTNKMINLSLLPQLTLGVSSANCSLVILGITQQIRVFF